MEHAMHVRKTPFDLIASDQKRYEIRLNGAKRQQITVGDTLFLTQNEDPTETLRARVTSLVHAPTFKELFEKISPLAAGCPETDSPEQAAERQRQYYSEEEERTLGTVAIGLALEP